MLTYSYDVPLVAASLAISLMAAFTGLSLTKGISALGPRQRKTLIAMAATALGGGIWSMHFVATLALKLPVPIYYDGLRTLGSALIAILLAGIALLIMHFAPRSRRNIVLAGIIIGNGIVAMHYFGMSGIKGCLPIFDLTGQVLAVLFASAIGIAAIWVAYGKRSKQHIVAGTLVFGSSVVVVHFTAMYWTGFAATSPSVAFTPSIDNGDLALIVTLSAFLICGTFLLSATTFVFPAAEEEKTTAPQVTPSRPATAAAAPDTPDGPDGPVRVPYERDNKSYFISSDDIAAIRAEGHYTILYAQNQKLFCPWSISTAEARLPAADFHRTHRSYLVNIGHVSGFERHKDNGACLFDDLASLTRVPVSRSRVNDLRQALGL